MPAPMSLVRVVRDLNQVLTDAGHAGLARSDDAWTQAVHGYIGRRPINDFLDDSLAPVMDRLDAAERPDPEAPASASSVWRI